MKNLKAEKISNGYLTTGEDGSRTYYTPDELVGILRAAVTDEDNDNLFILMQQCDGALVISGDDINLEAIEKQVIEYALRRTGGNRRLASEMVGISERNLYRKIQQYSKTDQPQ